MDPEIQNMVSLLERTFEKGAWHGPSVKETIADISEKQAFTSLQHTHSIIELVAHMTAWRRYVIQKLAGDLAYSVTDDLNFPKPRVWAQTVTDLLSTHNELLKAFQGLPLSKLYQQVPWTHEPFTYYSILHGIIHHDLYHIGQINLIKKSWTEQSFYQTGNNMFFPNA